MLVGGFRVTWDTYVIMVRGLEENIHMQIIVMAREKHVAG
jgi:hypothetical protein